MTQAFFWGLCGGSFLLLGGWLAYHFALSRSVIAVVMALGSGVLIGSVVYELIDEALKTESVGRVGVFFLVGAAALFVVKLCHARSARPTGW